MIHPDDPRLKFVPFDEASIPSDGLLNCYKDRYWITHPDKGIAFFRRDSKDASGSPQCNPNPAVVETVKARMYPWAEVKQIPFVFVKVNSRLL